MRGSTLGVLAAVVLATATAGCEDGPTSLQPTAGHLNGFLATRPTAPTGRLLSPGRHVLDLGRDRNPVVYVPTSYDPAEPAPLLVLFHGGGADAEEWGRAYTHPERLGVVLLMMQSDAGTWDVVHDYWGIDVAVVDRALEVVFDRVAIDPSSVAFGGFSDGATYALSLGLTNPELVKHAIAFSPGTFEGMILDPKPRVFISQGVDDPIFPAFNTYRIVQRLEFEGYSVTYVPFDGGHEVPADVVTGAMDWLVE